MTDLQLALLGLGVLIIVGIVLFNWWQERRFRTDLAQRFDEPRQDALMEEPHFDSDAILKKEPAISGDANQPAPELTSPPISAELAGDAEIVNDSLNEVNLAMQEFEQDMAKPYEEAEPETYAQDADSAEVPEEAATTEELTEEAGLDKEVVSAADFNQAAFDSADTGSTKLPATVNPQIDLIALLYLSQPATGAVLRELLVQLADLDKPIFAHGLDSKDAWHLLTREQEGAKFTRAAYSLQVADRSGFISKPSLNRFQNAVDSVANKLGAQAEWQNSGDPWLFASELDQFCVDVDKMVGFHLVQGDSGPFTGTKFRGLAEASGLVLGQDGAFHSESDDTHKLFSVVNRENNPFSTEMLRTSVIHGVSFQLDIPRVKNCIEIFNQMVLVARQMENSLNASLVDDKGRPLGEAEIEKIRQQLKVIHAKMVARGVIPGSDSALRLFS